MHTHLELPHIKNAVALVWLATIGGTALLASNTALLTWIMLSGCAIVPALLTMHYWNHPAESMSERIQRGRD